MNNVDFSPLDGAEGTVRSFYPRRNWSAAPEGAEDHSIPVDAGVALSARFFPVGPASPTVLFFYGNGETVVDYNGIAPLYNQTGMNFFVADYRGYGNSGGSPSFSTMLSDSVKVLEAARRILADGGFADHVYVMGRSMGRHSAFELAANHSANIKGVIIESGRPTLAGFTTGLSPEAAGMLGEAYANKVRSISIPALVIHGELDELAPVADAVSMYQEMASTDKRLLTIPGAGHNDLLYVGLNEYFTAVRDFVSARPN